MKSFPTLILAGFLSSNLLTGQALAQTAPGPPVPPQNFATTHLWASPGAISIRHLGMGSAYAGDDRGYSIGNPASVTAVKTPTAFAIYSTAGFSQLPTFRGVYAGYVTPLNRSGKTVLEVAVARSDVSGAIRNAPIPLQIKGSESDAGIEIGHEVNDRLRLGVALGYLGTSSRYSVSGAGDLQSMRSQPTGFGGRLGVTYQVIPTVSAGLTYDNYQEYVKSRVNPTGQEFGNRFRSVALRGGIAVRPDAKTTLLFDRETVSLEGGGGKQSFYSTLMGAERLVGSTALRLGLYEKRMSGGIGWRSRRLEVDYAFTNRYSVSLPGNGAKTSHAFQVTAHF